MLPPVDDGLSMPPPLALLAIAGVIVLYVVIFVVRALGSVVRKDVNRYRKDV
jgi:hypothetical protein